MAAANVAKFNLRSKVNLDLSYGVIIRKTQGTAFTTDTPIQSEYLTFLRKSEQLGCYESSPTKTRAFSEESGALDYSQPVTKPNVFRIRLGTIDADFSNNPVAHIFGEYKAKWYARHDSLPNTVNVSPEVEVGYSHYRCS